MNRLRAWIRNFFGFSRTETNAFLILLPLLILILLAEPAYQYWMASRPQNFSAETKELDSLISTFRWEQKDSAVHELPEKKIFRFNPNSSSKDEFVQLGFTESAANRIISYRTKGGKFYKKKDLLKIYGMDSSFYDKLYPFIDLPETNSAIPVAQKPAIHKKIIPEKFDLNKADTTQLIVLFGIGTKRAERIVSYRDRLGGFISFQQLHEVYSLDSAVISELKNKTFIQPQFIPQQLNINQATEKELSRHPYIKFKLAKAISAYRFQHGEFKSTDDLQKISILDVNTFQKIKPYIQVTQSGGN